MRSSEVSDATITLSNLGDRSVELVHGVIHPPQVALVGAGSPLPRAWADGDRVVVRPVIALTLAGDHRVSDGRRGGRFLRAVERLLQDPEAL
jgi:pyruvate dehydrogenase E2 component (dihydrolipoamide acetyltransferase)